MIVTAMAATTFVMLAIYGWHCISRRTWPEVSEGLTLVVQSVGFVAAMNLIWFALSAGDTVPLDISHKIGIFVGGATLLLYSTIGALKAFEGLFRER